VTALFAKLLLILRTLLASLLFLMAALTGADVIGRYVLNSPISGTDELIAAAMALLIFGGLPLVVLHNEQITVDITSGLFRGHAKRIQVFIVDLIGAVALGFLAVQLLVLAGKMMRNGDHSTFLYLPFGTLAYVLALMSALAAVFSLALAFYPWAERTDL
jgi:TRAP-type C4-dicarboxylate transport system permease small subunit